MVLQSRRAPSLSSFISSPSPSLPLSSPSAAAPRLPPTYRRFLPLLLFILPLTWYLSLSPSAASSLLTPPVDSDRSIPLSTLVALAESELEKRQRAHLSQEAEESDNGLELGFDITGDEISLEGYRSSIRKTLKEVFGWDGRSLVRSSSTMEGLDNSTSSSSLSSDEPSSSSYPSLSKDWWIDSTLSYLALELDPSSSSFSSKAPPTELFTTSSSPHLSSQFSSWKTLHPSWNLRYLDQSTIDSWVKTTFSGLVKEEWSKLENSPRTRREKRILDGLRQDLWKNLVLLQRAGMTVYADGDSAAVRPFQDWGKIDLVNQTPPLLALLPTLNSLPSSFSSKSPSSSVETLSPPSLIVSIEYDSTKGSDSWDQGTFARGIQIAQWTFAGSAGHPVFVDAVGRGIKLSQAYHAQLRSNKNTELSDDVIRDWAGPGIFSDCVFRYLLARWGVTPREIGNHGGPVRVGDVLILPERSFQADVSEQSSGTQDSVWHGFFPRWKASELFNDDQLLDLDDQTSPS